MTVSELSVKNGFSAITLPDPNREIKGVYIGDLLSWVMGKAREDDAWITIMSNVNVLAVASLSGTACVIFAEGVTVTDDVKKTAEQKGINLIGTEMSAYRVSEFFVRHGI